MLSNVVLWLALLLAVAGLAAAVVVAIVVLRGGGSRAGREAQARLDAEAESLRVRAERLDEDRAALERERAHWSERHDADRAALERDRDSWSARREAEREALDTDRRRWREERDAEHLALDELRQQAQARMAAIAGMSPDEARAEVRDGILHEARLAAAREARGIVDAAKREARQRAAGLIVEAIEHVAAEQTAETVVVMMTLPNDDMKGRIIGREGRNIRAFEQLTGANILIDESQTLLLSCFDPVRREIARLMLEALVADGNIHPARIEHEHVRAQRRIDEVMAQAADDALAEVGIVDLAPELKPLLGRLAFRSSYGQNVLRHLVESAQLAGTIAAELGLDVVRCRRAAFLHDIGKALTPDHQGSHALLGAELLRRHGEDPDIVHAVEAHHDEVEPATVEAVLVQAADAISGSRPGARKESLEAYVERMEQLERIATAKPGVARAFAMQAGHEVRVMVQPTEVGDDEAQLMAREIASEIESSLTYPGQIRVTVIRESRATATAH